MLSIRHRLAFSFCLTCSATAWAQDPMPDGFYTGPNTRTELNLTGASLVSVDNLNSRYQLSLTTTFDNKPLSGLWLKIGDTAIRCTSHGSNKGISRSYGFSEVDPQVVNAVASMLGIKPHSRKHPGYRLAVRFEADKAEFAAGDPVTATLTIKNVGTKPFSFMDGGRNRGARNNQFSFTCRRNGRAVLDTGDAVHFGGLGRSTNRQTRPEIYSLRRFAKVVQF